MNMHIYMHTKKTQLILGLFYYKVLKYLYFFISSVARRKEKSLRHYKSNQCFCEYNIFKGFLLVSPACRGGRYRYEMKRESNRKKNRLSKRQGGS